MGTYQLVCQFLQFACLSNFFSDVVSDAANLIFNQLERKNLCPWRGKHAWYTSYRLVEWVHEVLETTKNH